MLGTLTFPSSRERKGANESTGVPPLDRRREEGGRACARAETAAEATRDASLGHDVEVLIGDVDPRLEVLVRRVFMFVFVFVFVCICASLFRA